MTDLDRPGAAYRAGLCIDCKALEYSAGRVRCNACHAAFLEAREAGWVR